MVNNSFFFSNNFFHSGNVPNTSKAIESATFLIDKIIVTPAFLAISTLGRLRIIFKPLTVNPLRAKLTIAHRGAH